MHCFHGKVLPHLMHFQVSKIISYIVSPWYNFASYNHMQRAYMDFSNCSCPPFLHEGECRLNQNRFWPNSLERSVHGVGFRDPLNWSLVGPGAIPWWGPGGRAPINSWVLGLLRLQNASPRIIFFNFSDKFWCKISCPCWYTIQNDKSSCIYLVQTGPFIRIGLQGGTCRSDLILRNDFLVNRGVWGCAPWEAGKFCIFETGIVQFGEYL